MNVEIYACCMFDGDLIYHINFFSCCVEAVKHFNDNGGFKSYDSIYAIQLDEPKAQWRKIVMHSSEGKIFSFYDERFSQSPFLFNEKTKTWEPFPNVQ